MEKPIEMIDNLQRQHSMGPYEFVSVEDCVKLMEKYAKSKAGQQETIVIWRDVYKEMPDAKNVEKRTQFLLKGVFAIPGLLGSFCYVVSRLDEAAYTCGDEIVFETPVGFIPTEWTNIE